jgi:hypothetical protein
MNQRVCRRRGCQTRVSRYSASDRCDIHTRERNAMSGKFIENIRGTYRLTREERRRFYEGGGA